MKKTMLVFSAIILAGCASKSVHVTPSPVKGSKSDGIIIMGYMLDKEPMTNTHAIVNWSGAEQQAIKKCQKWGYRTAEKFSGFTTSDCQEQKIDYMWTGEKYCSKELVTVSYQCEK